MTRVSSLPGRGGRPGWTQPYTDYYSHWLACGDVLCQRAIHGAMDLLMVANRIGALGQWLTRYHVVEFYLIKSGTRLEPELFRFVSPFHSSRYGWWIGMTANRRYFQENWGTGGWGDGTGHTNQLLFCSVAGISSVLWLTVFKTERVTLTSIVTWKKAFCFFRRHHLNLQGLGAVDLRKETHNRTLLALHPRC